MMSVLVCVLQRKRANRNTVYACVYVYVKNKELALKFRILRSPRFELGSGWPEALEEKMVWPQPKSDSLGTRGTYDRPSNVTFSPKSEKTNI